MKSRYAFLFLYFTVVSVLLTAQNYSLVILEKDGKELPFSPKTNYSGVFERRDALRDYVIRLQDLGFLAAGIDSLSGDEKKQTAHLYLGQQFNWSNLYPIDVDAAALSAGGYRNRLYSDRAFRLNATPALLIMS